MMTRLISPIFAFLLCLAAAPSEAPCESSLTIGGVLALSGDAAIHGTAIKNGMELAAEELSARGEFIKLSFQDDQTRPHPEMAS